MRFRYDYGGGWGKYRRLVWPTFADACKPYTGPRLDWLVAACTAPDGSHWALQAWRRYLPHRGFPSWRPDQAARELRISHWTDELARLEAHADWAFNGDAHGLFGRLTYRGVPVHGFRSTRNGEPLDRYGRNLYIDTYDSAYGGGWHRETSILFRRPTGSFCYSFWPTRDVSLPGRPAASRRPRQPVPDHRRGSGRHAGRRLGGTGPAGLRSAQPRPRRSRAADGRGLPAPGRRRPLLPDAAVSLHTLRAWPA